MSDVSEKQSLEFFTHGLRKSEAAARGLARITKKHHWTNIANALTQLRSNGEKMFNMRALTDTEVLVATAHRQKQLEIMN